MHSPRSALHANTFEAASLFVTAETGQLVYIEMHVARNEKIEMPIAIIVGPSRPGAEAAARDPCFLGHIFKLTVAEIVIERIAPVAGDVNIRETVIVVIGDRNSHSPAFA